jgi:hypothetical protein
MGINENPKNNKPNNVEAQRGFYNWLAQLYSYLNL